jgi:hypothetical protein
MFFLTIYSKSYGLLIYCYHLSQLLSQKREREKMQAIVWSLMTVGQWLQFTIKFLVSSLAKDYYFVNN